VGNKNTNRERKQGKVDVKVLELIPINWRYIEGFGRGMVFMLLWFSGGAMACIGVI